MMAPVTVSELLGLTIMSFMATSSSRRMVPQIGCAVVGRLLKVLKLG